MIKIENYYDTDHFNLYQKKIGEFGGKANVFKFKDHILKTDSVLDFGCGGGFLLSNLDCKYKAGIEIKSVARNLCKNDLQIDCFSSIGEVEDEKYDVIISKVKKGINLNRNIKWENTVQESYNFINK